MTRLTKRLSITYSQQSITFNDTMETLDKLKITLTSGFMDLKPNLKERIEATTFLGENELWSSQNLYRHLDLLENHVPRRACSRLFQTFGKHYL